MSVFVFATPEPPEHEKALREAKRQASRKRSAQRKRLSSGRPVEWRECALDGCGKRFTVGSRPTRRYCTRSHKQRARERRRAAERRLERLREMGIDLDSVFDFDG